VARGSAGEYSLVGVSDLGGFDDGYLIFAALGLSVRGGRVWSRHRQQVLLRREMRAQEVTFRTSVAVLLRQPYGWPQWLSLNGLMALIVRGDAIEISGELWPIRMLPGMGYYFWARETTMQVRRAPSGPFDLRWLVVTGRQGGKEVTLAISADSSYQLCRAWSAMIDAGVLPVGPPPPDQAGRGRWAPRLYDQ
jgi:hypothetical protein